MKIRLSKSSIGQAEKEAVTRVLDKEYLGMGEEVQCFEDELKSFLKTDKEVTCVNSGTSALHLALQACGIGRGHEVLVPSLTYVASFQAISATGAVPVACDVLYETFFIDVNDAAKRITPKTRAVMPVHYASDSQFMGEVHEFAGRHGLRVIEDAAHSFGCKRDGKYIGVDGDVICFSFDGIKNITSGEGGAVLSSDPEVAQKVCDARLLGVERDTEKRFQGQRSWEFDVKEQGWRYHMSNIMAAIGREQLKNLASIRRARQAIAERYLKSLASLEHIEFLKLDFKNIIPHIFVIRVKDGHRDRLRSFLLENNVECGIHYYPNHWLAKYRNSYALPAVEAAYSEVLSLPCHIDLWPEEQDYVVQKVKGFLESDL